MIKLIFYVLLFWVFYKLWRLLNPPANTGAGRPSAPLDNRHINGGELVQDPQCGVYIPESTAIKGATGRRFCSEACRSAYEKKGG